MSYYHKYIWFFGSIYLFINSDLFFTHIDVNFSNVCKNKMFCFLELFVFSLQYACRMLYNYFNSYVLCRLFTFGVFWSSAIHQLLDTIKGFLKLKLFKNVHKLLVCQLKYYYYVFIKF